MAKYEKYIEYKDSGITWMGDVPKHWTSERFKWLLSEKLKTSNPDLPAGSISFGEVIYKNEENLSSDTKASYQEVLKYEFLINPLNLNYDLKSLRTALSKIDVVVSTGYIVLHCDQSLNKNYVRWLLQEFDVAHMKTLGAGVRQTVNFSDIANCYFYLPEQSEQIKIANFLDHETSKIDSLIEKQQQLIELLKEKRQAVISHAVTKGLNPDVAMKDSGVEWLGQVPEHWTIPQIGYHAEVTKLTGFEYTNLWMPQEDGKIIALRGFNIQERYLDLNKTERISRNLSSKLFRSKLFKGDLVLPCTGTLGNAALIESDDTFHINQNIAKVTFDKRLFVPEFCLYWVTSQPFRQMIDFNNTSGMQPVLLIGDIRKLPISLCSIDEQIKIVAYLDNQTQKMGELIRKAESAIQLMQERRTALISAAVTGKIDVRNWQNPNNNNEAKMEFSA